MELDKILNELLDALDNNLDLKMKLLSILYPDIESTARYTVTDIVSLHIEEFHNN